MQNFRRMQRSFAGTVFDLVTTAGTCRSDNHILLLTSYGWEQNQFTNFHRKIEVLFLIAERTRHTTASGWDHVHFGIGNEAQGFFRWGHG